MKTYGITYATIHGLNTDKTKRFDNNFNSSYFLHLFFKNPDMTLPFDADLDFILYEDPTFSDYALVSIKEKFSRALIKDGDKVTIIYDVITGKIIAIGKTNYDLWLKLKNRQVCSFSKLNINNCSLIPYF